MELYTLTNKFLPKHRVGPFTSAIWTERYFSAGDFQLVVQAIPSQIDKLAKGTFLGLRGTKEIMQIETQSIKDGLLTVTGSSITKFFHQRLAWFKNTAYDGSDTSVSLAAEYVDTTTIGQFIAAVVDMLLIFPVDYDSYWDPINLEWSSETITGLELGRVDTNGPDKRFSFPLGSLYDGIQRLAEEEGLGFKLYLDSASYSGSYVLKFATYRGKDRTSTQFANRMVRLSPKTDSLTDIEEINSITQYKNVVYVLYKNEISAHYGIFEPGSAEFDRRVVLVEAPDIEVATADIPAFREQIAHNTMISNDYIQVVDGQIMPDIGYTFGVDYSLGDIIELEGFTGAISRARITEYIRYEDQFGERKYPTLSAIDPLLTGYMPVVEPDPEFTPPWYEDPDYDFDFDFEENDPRDDPEYPPPGETDPRDPVDPNPDPIPDWDGDGDGDGGDGDGDGDGEALIGGELILDPGNEYSYSENNPSWYKHHDRIYLEGAVYYGSLGDPEGRITIEGGVPVAARPAVDTAVTIYPDMPDSDSVYGDFTSFEGVVTTDGTLSLSPIPYPSLTGIDLYLMLGNISWKVNPYPVNPPPDTVTQESLEPWLISGGDPTATTDDAVIGAHGVRAHLNGEVMLLDGSNLIGGLPTQYRSAHNDVLPILGGPGGVDWMWWPAFLNETGYLTFKSQASKPLLRAASLSEWIWGDEWGYGGPAGTADDPLDAPLADTRPADIWYGAAPEDVMTLSGRWSAPVFGEVGTEFGFVITYAFSEFSGSGLFYKVAAEKMGPEFENQWWLMLTIYRNADPASGVYLRIPMARLDTPAFPGLLPNGVSMNATIEPISVAPGVQGVKISSTVFGTTHMFEWPQHVDDEGPVWPSEIGQDNKWGAIYTTVPDTDGVPVSFLSNIKGVSASTPVLPNFGLASAGYEFNLDDVGWRVS